MVNRTILLLVLIIYSTSQAQKVDNSGGDTLSGKDYQYFIDKLDSEELKDEAAAVYAKAYLAKAKLENNWTEITHAYKSLLHLSNFQNKRYYSDSIIVAAKNTKDKSLIGGAFLTKGVVFYEQKSYVIALDNYLLANDLIAETGDLYLLNKIKFGIAQIKYYLGFYDDAIALFEQCVVYFKNDGHQAYLNSLHGLSLCYTKTGKYNLSEETINTGIKKATNDNNEKAIAYFTHALGINEYFKGNYQSSIEKLLRVLPVMVKGKDLTNEVNAYFYIGKSYLGLELREKGIGYLKLVDNAFIQQKYIRPDLREAYELLIDYYISEKDQEAELIYIKRLMAADKILDKDYEYLSGKISKEYDFKELVLEKNRIEKSLIKRNNIEAFFIGFIVLLITTIIILVYKHFTNKKRYRLKFEQVMQQLENPFEYKKPISEGELDINPEKVNSILSHLTEFETDNLFLDKEMTLTNLAALCESNTKYVSKVISHCRGKKYIAYVNELRIDFILNLLKNDYKYRLYSNKALGEEAGFSTTQHFTRAFLSRTEISPSYYIKALEKNSKNLR